MLNGKFDIGLLRFVDDVITLSPSYCHSCAALFTRTTYSVSSSLASDPSLERSEVTRLDLRFQSSGDTFIWAPKNPNREWLFDVSRQREPSAIIPWPGVLPRAFGMLYGALAGRLARSRMMRLSPSLTAVWIMEA
eukprot:5553378-Pyramimonas_sp.AAC.1